MEEDYTTHYYQALNQDGEWVDHEFIGSKDELHLGLWACRQVGIRVRKAGVDVVPTEPAQEQGVGQDG